MIRARLLLLTFLGVEAYLEHAGLAPPLPVLTIVLAEDVELDIGEADPAPGDSP
jgi:hypothetical protein